MTGFISVHSVEEAESVCSRMLVLKKGKTAFIGTAAELRNEYKCGYRLTFLGENVEMDRILEVVQTVIPEASAREDFSNMLVLPVDLKVADVLEVLEAKKSELGIGRYTVQIEGLEETMRKIIEDEEALIQNS
jgi:ABC-type multidrug transport system ATPase subunit